jgi:ribose 5-phosphate isomerase B
MMRIAIGVDWIGYELKQGLIELMEEKLGHEVLDFGANSDEPCDYPDFAEAVGRAVAGGEVDRGIVVCGTGIGMSIAANKIPGVRAALCHDAFTTALSRSHNDANVLAMGVWVVSLPHARELVELWLETPYDGGRHVPRLEKIARLDQNRLSWGKGGASED